MCTELRFSRDTSKHILLLPGMMTPASALFPLVRYLRENQKEYGVTAIPLGLSLPSFTKIIERSAKRIADNLLHGPRPKTVILFGHSYGGRVACELARTLKKQSPATEFIVITAGTPMAKRSKYLPLYLDLFFSISSAYRSWPTILQPDASIVSNYFGYYSDSDEIVMPDFARNGYLGRLTELHGVSHHELTSPTVIGPLLLTFINQN